MPAPGLVGTGRPSALVEADPQGRIVSWSFADADDEIVAALGAEPGLLVVDAPVRVTNEDGRRGVEEVLAWCDIPTFPVSGRRLDQVFGGRRGVTLAERVDGRLHVVETLPDVVLRVLQWEDDHGALTLDLADYRARWLGRRPPVYRPKGPGRARPAGVAAAAAILARHVDTGGWVPTGTDDWGAIRDAALVDALACAYLAVRALSRPETTVRIGSTLLPVDPNLAARIALHADRLGVDAISGAPPPP
jgi:predicted nuclease with RNAse H fold